MLAAHMATGTHGQDTPSPLPAACRPPPLFSPPPPASPTASPSLPPPTLPLAFWPLPAPPPLHSPLPSLRHHRYPHRSLPHCHRPSPQPPSPPPPLTAASLTATAPHRSLPHRHRPLPTSKGGPHRSHRRQPQVQPHGPRRRRLPGRSLHSQRWDSSHLCHPPCGAGGDPLAVL